MKKIVIVLLSMVVVIICVSCKSTPEQEIIIQKSNFESIISGFSDEKPQQYSAPALLVDVVEKNKLMIKINAPVFIPQVQAFPIYSVASVDYSQNQVNMAVDTFFQGAAMYKTSSIAYSKQELTEMLLWQKKLLGDVKSGKNTSYVGTIEHLESEIKELERQINQADSQYPTMQDASDFSEDGELDVYGTVNGSRVFFVATTVNTLFMRYYADAYVDTAALLDGEEIKNTISRNAAEKEAYNCVRRLGYSDADLNAASIGEKLSTAEEVENDESSKVYVFYFTKTVDGIPLTYEERGRTGITGGKDALSDEEMKIYSRPREYEYVRIVVDADGIREVYINGNMILKDKTNESVRLLPFEDIISRAREHLFQKFQFVAPLDQIGAEKRIINIDRIKLGYMQVTAKDVKEQNLLIPVWDFFGWEDIQIGDKTQGVTLKKHRSFVTINAIDGSIIDRDLGY